MESWLVWGDGKTKGRAHARTYVRTHEGSGLRTKRRAGAFGVRTETIVASTSHFLLDEATTMLVLRQDLIS